ncbi:MAG: chitobiase/beta-hexosaminidase C-terminal domain-containing protein [Prevotella sp.]|nr:chitobiase/beta-hexosaminidase C-terminal domain-containing protein [Prevotella sp.]
MNLKHLLTKALLVVAMLGGGTTVLWADGTLRTLSSENYEAASDAFDWTAWNSDMLSLATGDATYGNYVKVDIGSTAANRGAYKTITPAYTFGTGYTTAAMTTLGYNVELDLKIQSGNTANRSKSDFVVPTAAFTTTTGTYSGTNYVFSLSQPTRDTNGASTMWYINDLDNTTGSTVTLSSSVWYHVKLVCTASSVAYTITNSSTSVDVATGSKAVDAIPSIWGLWTAVGRGYGFTYIDNINIYDYSSTDNVSTPSIDVAYNATNRTVTITGGTSTLGNNVTTYYTTDGTDPSSSSNVYSSPLDIDANCTIKAITISSSGAESTVVSQEVTVGKLTLATPTISATGFTNATGLSVNNPTFNFASNNSDLLGSPTATLSYTFTPDGGAESEATAGSSYTPTQYGTLKVVASADGYNSSEKSLVVSSLYTVSYTGRDYITATTSDISTTEGAWGDNYSVEWDGWESGLTANLLNINLSDDYHFRIQNTGTISLVNGWGWVRGDQKTYGYQSRYATEGNFVALKENYSKGEDASATTYQTVYCSSGTGIATSTITITAPAGYAVQQLYHYSASPTSVTKTISSAGWATYCSPYALDFSSAIDNLDAAYIVTGGTNGVLNKTAVTGTVPANTGLLLKGSEGTVTIPVTASGTTDVSANIMTGVTTATEIAAEAGWVLMVSPSLGFYKNTNAFTVGANTAYIPTSKLSDPTTARKYFSLFADETTGIANVSENVDDDTFVDLSGRRVAQPTKGLYIVNGKKVLVK